MQMKELIDGQKEKFERAVPICGKYEFEDDYRHLGVSEAKWLTPPMSKHLQKVAITWPQELSHSEAISVMSMQIVASSLVSPGEEHSSCCLRHLEEGI